MSSDPNRKTKEKNPHPKSLGQGSDQAAGSGSLSNLGADGEGSHGAANPCQPPVDAASQGKNIRSANKFNPNREAEIRQKRLQQYMSPAIEEPRVYEAVGTGKRQASNAPGDRPRKTSNGKKPDCGIASSLAQRNNELVQARESKEVMHNSGEAVQAQPAKKGREGEKVAKGKKMKQNNDKGGKSGGAKQGKNAPKVKCYKMCKQDDTWSIGNREPGSSLTEDPLIEDFKDLRFKDDMSLRDVMTKAFDNFGEDEVQLVAIPPGPTVPRELAVHGPQKLEDVQDKLAENSVYFKLLKLCRERGMTGLLIANYMTGNVTELPRDFLNLIYTKVKQQRRDTLKAKLFENELPTMKKLSNYLVKSCHKHPDSCRQQIEKALAPIWSKAMQQKHEEALKDLKILFCDFDAEMEKDKLDEMCKEVIRKVTCGEFCDDKRKHLTDYLEFGHQVPSSSTETDILLFDPSSKRVIGFEVKNGGVKACLDKAAIQQHPRVAKIFKAAHGNLLPNDWHYHPVVVLTGSAGLGDVQTATCEQCLQQHVHRPSGLHRALDAIPVRTSVATEEEKRTFTLLRMRIQAFLNVVSQDSSLTDYLNENNRHIFHPVQVRGITHRAIAQTEEGLTTEEPGDL